MTARGIIAGIILMTVIANGGIATTENEFRNDNILLIELRKCVRQQLPELGDAKVVALANHLVDSRGVGEMDDLRHVEESDLIEHLKPIQIRKLLEGMKACGSDKKRDANKNKTPNGPRPSTEEDSKDSSSGTSSKILKRVGIGAAAIVGAGLVAAAPLVLPGVSAGSLAATAAHVVANLVAISVFPDLQSTGAEGTGDATTTGSAATGATVAGGTAYKVLKDGDTEKVKK